MLRNSWSYLRAGFCEVSYPPIFFSMIIILGNYLQTYVIVRPRGVRDSAPTARAVLAELELWRVLVLVIDHDG